MFWNWFKSCLILFSKLNTNPEKPYFIHSNNKIYTIFDIPLIITESVRNIIHKHDIHVDNTVVSWQDMKKTFEIDRQSATTRAMPKITEKHVNLGVPF